MIRFWDFKLTGAPPLLSYMFGVEAPSCGGPPVSEDAEADGYLEECQSLTHYRFEGKLYPRLPYGSETFGAPAPVGRKPCRHCDAVKGQLHEPLCDYEQCPVCGEQVMSCDCGIFTEDAVPGP